jgi:hypothetical protein
MSDAVGAAESSFAGLAHHADSYTSEHYTLAVSRWVHRQHAVALAFATYQHRRA